MNIEHRINTSTIFSLFANYRRKACVHRHLHVGAEMSDGYQWLEHVRGVSMKIPAKGEWFAVRENSFTTQG